MKEQVLVLYEVQSVDIKIAEAQTRLEAMDGARAYRKRYSAAKAAYDAAEKALLTQETDLKDSELTLKSIDDKRTGYEKRLYAGNITNPKELSAVEREIKALKGQQAELDGKVLGLYETAEEARTRVGEAKSALENAEKQARAAIKKEAAEKVQLEALVSELTAQREEMIKAVTDRALLARYAAVRKRTGSTAVAKIDEGKCDGCHVSITAYIMRNLYTTGEVQLCENCGRILIMVLE